MQKPQDRIAIVDFVGCKAGMDLYDSNLAAGLIKVGVDVLVVSNFTADGVPATVLFKKETPTRFSKFWNFFYGHFKAFYLLRKRGFKKFIFHSFSFEWKDLLVLTFSKLLGLRLFLIVHDVSGFADSDNGYVKRIVIGKVADKVLVHNQFSKATLLKGFPGEIEFKTHIVKHGNFEDSSVSLTSKEVARNILGLSGDKFYLLFFGQIKKVKGLELLLEALSNVIDKNVCLIIAGKPWKNDFNEYQKLIDDKGLADRIVAKIGFIENQDRDLLFSAADLLVLPYHRIYQSGVALMAMTFGVPLLTSDLEPFVELIQKDKNGNIFVSGNSESLANKILEVKENYSDALVKSQNGMRHVIEEYDWVKIARNYKEIL